MTETAISAAMRRAGIVPASERLLEVAVTVLRMSDAEWKRAQRSSWDDPAQKTRLLGVAMDAIKNNRRNWDGARDALYAAVREDAALLWALFEPYRMVAVQKLLHQAAQLVHDQEVNRQTITKLNPKPMAGGAVPAAKPGATSATSATPKSENRDRGDRQRREGRRILVPSKSSMADVSQLVRKSMLDTFTIGDHPIGDMTPNQARSWARNNAARVRFVELLTANLPPNDPIRRYRTGDEADALWRQAQQESGLNVGVSPNAA